MSLMPSGFTISVTVQTARSYATLMTAPRLEHVTKITVTRPSRPTRAPGESPNESNTDRRTKQPFLALAHVTKVNEVQHVWQQQITVNTANLVQRIPRSQNHCKNGESNPAYPAQPESLQKRRI